VFLARPCTGLLFLSGAGASAKNCQLAAMSLKPGEDIGAEVHELDPLASGSTLEAAAFSIETQGKTPDSRFTD
jgi:hypothetical protein